MLRAQMRVNQQIIRNLAEEQNSKSFMEHLPALPVSFSSGGSEAYQALLYQTAQLTDKISSATAAASVVLLSDDLMSAADHEDEQEEEKIITVVEGSSVSGSSAPPTATADSATSNSHAHFTNPHRVVPSLGGYFDCASHRAQQLHADPNLHADKEYLEHFGGCNVCLDPLTQDWTVWWTCCGLGETLVEAVTPPVDNTNNSNNSNNSSNNGSSDGGNGATDGKSRRGSGSSTTGEALSHYYDTVRSSVNQRLDFLSFKSMYSKVKQLVV